MEDKIAEKRVLRGLEQDESVPEYHNILTKKKMAEKIRALEDEDASKDNQEEEIRRPNAKYSLIRSNFYDLIHLSGNEIQLYCTHLPNFRKAKSNDECRVG